MSNEGHFTMSGKSVQYRCPYQESYHYTVTRAILESCTSLPPSITSSILHSWSHSKAPEFRDMG